MEEEIKTENDNWHSVGAKEVLTSLGSGREGLSLEEAQKRLLQIGPNRLPQAKKSTALKIFLNQFKSPLIYILLFAGIIVIFLKEYVDMAVIWGAIILNVVIGFFQENKASQALEKLKHVIHLKARVVRQGHYQEIETEGVVPGDIIILKPGDKVPADGRLFQGNNLEINEAALTGEWLSARKSIKPLPCDSPLADRDNMVYQGTSVVAGSGRAVVVGTGNSTELARIALLVRETVKEASPLKEKVARLARILGAIFILISILIIGISLLRGLSLAQSLILAVALAVSAVPEGLPIAVTVILALGMKRILKKKGLVRKLIAAETLGCTSIICSDKTGTLTRGKMKISQVLAVKKNLALKIAMLASEIFVENLEADPRNWIVRGRSTDKALFWGGVRAGLDYRRLDKESPLLAELPFDQDRKYLAALRKLNTRQGILYVSGAPEVILKQSINLAEKNRIGSLGTDKRRELQKDYQDLAAQGARVIAVAYRKIKAPKAGRAIDLEQYCQKLIFVGFLALSDPLRKEARETINRCRRAGLRPIIVTGDHKLTAQNIAKELNLPSGEQNILEGKDLDKMSDRELQARVEEISIYARVSPKHKLKIISAWQEKGEVVAMTGDGVNDAPALAAADIGVALGSGTDVAREVSDLVLLDNNFSVIVAAIKQGRMILDNIRKVIVYLLSDAFEEILLVASSIIFGLPLPILPIQILWINLIEDGLPDLALAFEPAEAGVMAEKPRRRSAPLLNREMKVLIFVIGLVTDFILLTLFWLLFHHSLLGIKHIRTIIFATLSLNSLLYVFSCRSFRHSIWHMNPFNNKYLTAAAGVSLLILIVSIYVPFLQTLLKTESLRLQDWLLIIVLAIIDLAAIEIAKFFFIVRKHRRSSQ